MQNYYTEEGKLLGRAWSTMHCQSTDDHPPHVHNPKFAMYGPYMCGGLPKTLLFDTKDRKPVN